MENTSLEYFLEVCACGSISKAGKSLHVTPQAVSKAINSFEKKLGCQLLIRSIDGCIPTAKGLEVQRIGIRLQRFEKQAMQQIYNMSQEKPELQSVHIGVWGAFATIMPPADYSDFNAMYPEIQLCFHSFPDFNSCERALVSNEVELAFCGPETEGCGFTCLQEYGSIPLLIVNGKNRLADKGRVKVLDICGEKLIADYAINNRNVLFRDEIEKAGIVPSLILPMGSDALKRELVLRDNYVAFSYCPPGWLPYGLIPLIVADIHNYESSCFSRASNRPLSEAAQKYVDYIVPRFKKDIFGKGAS